MPQDLLEQVRGRVRVLSALLLFAFGADVVIAVLGRTAVALGYADDFAGAAAAVTWANGGAVVLSAALFIAARSDRVSAASLHTVGLVYEVVICFLIGLLSNLAYFTDHGLLPNLTWVPAVVILFPLILPGPPARMLLAACAAAAMGPLSIVVLAVLGAVAATVDAYVQACAASIIAIVFANMGARIVYGLGRQVEAARELGSYLLEAKLGEGGMGEVWRARHRLLARPAAIKLIRADGAPRTDEARQRFEREAQATSQLCSPYTVDLYDFGVAADGTFYYVMELLDGINADALVRHHGPLPAARVIHLLRQVCHSLSEAESLGLVHRDVKPANILVCRYGQDCDFVKVLDFGLVKTFGDAATTSPALTRESVVAGTPPYMAPEQVSGGGLDGRTDLYALGCVAFWLLTGQTVFMADSPVGHLVHHVQTTPDAPSRRTEIPVPPELDAIVLACLSKSPDDRPRSAGEVAERLRRVPVSPPWTTADADAWWETHLPAGPDRVARGQRPVWRPSEGSRG